MITQTARNIPVFALAITMLALVSACSSQPVAPVTQQPTGQRADRSPSTGERAAAVALQQVGVPYRYGGATSSGFDCSGLIQFSYGRAGKYLPRTTGQLWSSTSTVGRNDLQVGDLLFFRIEGKMSHVGLYIGRQQFVHAPSSGRTVTVAKLASPFYSAAFIRGGRPN